MPDHRTTTKSSGARSTGPAASAGPHSPPAGPAATDARLTAAVAAVRDGSAAVLTLDVFDTFLWRKVPEPANAFFLLGARLDVEGCLAPDIDGSSFAELRSRAERRARELRAHQGGGEEVTLSEICELVPRWALRISPYELAEKEVALERSLLVADLDVTELARDAKERGLRVACVSDTYFSEGHVRSFLDSGPAGAVEVDHVFVSSDYRVGKTGGLWRIVINALGVDPSKVVHVGDNHEADVAASGRAGVRGVYFERRPPELARVIGREDLHGVAPLSPYHGDYGMTALRSKVLHRTERRGQPVELHPFWSFGAGSLGPPMAGFAEWVHERAADAGAGRVFCMMREGRLLSQLVNAAAPAAQTAAVAQPIWLSRQVCARASIFDGSAAEIATMFQRRRMPTVGELCSTLGVQPDEVAGFAELANARLSEPHLARRLVDGITADAELRARIVASSAQLRARLVRYLEELRPPGADRLLLLDLGWGATIQTLLDSLLRGAGSDLRTVGLYLMTTDRAAERMLDGTEAHGYLANAGHPQRMVEAFMRSPELLEQICMPDHGSQIDLDERLDPVLGPIEALPIQAAEREAVQKGIAAFQREWVRYRTTLPDELAPLHEYGQDRLRSVMGRAMTAPTADEAQLFAGWLHDENFGSFGLEPLVSAPSVRSARYLEPRALMETSMSDIYWPFGLAALHDEHLVRAVEAMNTGVVPWDEFSSGLESGDVEIYCDRGWGFRRQGMAVVEGRRNRLGLSYAGGTVVGDVIRRVRIDPAKGACVLRMDWIRLRCLPRSGGEAVMLDFTGPRAIEKLQMNGMRKIASGSYLVSGSDPNIVIDLRELAVEVHTVFVECGFAALPLPASGVRRRIDPLKEKARDRAKRGRLAGPVRAAYSLLRRFG
ncbi:MAG: HAD family hydrolase [Thermoleophilaceae bacterium]